MSTIPIFITSFNRLNALKEVIKSLETKNETNIIIMDNKSDYGPLLDYYEELKTKYKIAYLNNNYGHYAAWHSGILNDYRNQYYVVTDPDVIPVQECPKNFLDYFKTVLERLPSYDKIGFGLKLDDIPQHKYRDNIVGWESKYWEKEIEPGLYNAPIDTTFSLYKPGGPIGHSMNSIRTGFPYIARHETWYIDPDSLDVHDTYYYKSCKTPTHWSAVVQANDIK